MIQGHIQGQANKTISPSSAGSNSKWLPKILHFWIRLLFQSSFPTSKYVPEITRIGNISAAMTACSMLVALISITGLPCIEYVMIIGVTHFMVE